jgi:hypothetical protein
MRLMETDTKRPLIYFIVRGEHIKIGTTTNLPGRLNALQQVPADVLGTVPGGQRDEKSWHYQHRAEQLSADHYGGREWFTPSPRLIEAIARALGEQVDDVRDRYEAIRDRRHIASWTLDPLAENLRVGMRLQCGGVVVRYVHRHYHNPQDSRYPNGSTRMEVESPGGLREVRRWDNRERVALAVPAQVAASSRTPGQGHARH